MPELPERPDLDQLRRQAQELLRAVRRSRSTDHERSQLVERFGVSLDAIHRAERQPS